MSKPKLFNPWTGKPRDYRDIESDPDGKLMWDGVSPMQSVPWIKRRTFIQKLWCRITGHKGIYMKPGNVGMCKYYGKHIQFKL